MLDTYFPAVNMVHYHLPLTLNFLLLFLKSASPTVKVSPSDKITLHGPMLLLMLVVYTARPSVISVTAESLNTRLGVASPSIGTAEQGLHIPGVEIANGDGETTKLRFFCI